MGKVLWSIVIRYKRDKAWSTLKQRGKKILKMCRFETEAAKSWVQKILRQQWASKQEICQIFQDKKVMENEMGMIPSRHRNFRSAQNILPLKKRPLQKLCIVAK